MYKKYRNNQILNGFSLVELLMALLVASLLMAALAPVMTKKFGENVVVSGTGGVRGDYSRTFYEDFEWTVPNGVNTINITSIGGGGAGGGASYGYKEITSSESNWIVPDGVTKLRVFMTGAGGGGASGGSNKVAAYGSIPTTTETYTDYLTQGEHEVNVFPKSGYGAPEVDSKCKASGVNEWSLVSNESIKTPKDGIAGSTIRVTACGAGGGGGASYTLNNLTGGGGGSGGYITNIPFIVNFSKIYIKIPGGGGGGGSGKTAASQTHSGLPGGYSSGGGGGHGWQSAAGGAGGENGGSGGQGLDQNSDGFAGSGSDGLGNTKLSYGGGGRRHQDGKAGAGNGGRGSIWGGGGGGGSRRNAICGTPGGGGGGGGPVTISDASGISGNIIFQIGGGGGGGGGTINCYTNKDKAYNAAGGGGGGGGYGAGGGGGGAYPLANGISGSAGTGVACMSAFSYIAGCSTFKGIGKAACNPSGNSIDATGNQMCAGGGGGGGYGGGSGADAGRNTAGTVSTIFGPNYCQGGAGAIGAEDGTNGSTGKPGALRMYYGGAGKINAFKCYYKQALNGGGGGGAGQIWIGEIDVVPGQKINFNIGQGGNVQSIAGANGNDGTATSIVVNGKTYSVSGGKGGKYEDDNTYIANSGGFGGGLKSENFDSSARYINWAGSNLSGGGKNGARGYLISESENGAGGSGGATYKKDGTIVAGGGAGGSNSDGVNAKTENYGTGGGGGGAGQTGSDGGFGTGGKGANGYIYVEWGSTNGGGGSSGQVVVEKNVWVTAGTKIQITVGKGGEPRDILTSSADGVIGQFGQKGNDGSDSFITTNEGIKGRARGGIGGYPGTSVHGKGGNSEESTTEDKIIPNVAPGIDGSNDNGGRGGSITSELCPLFTSIEGLGGCGGMMLDNDNNMCLDPSSSGNGKNAGKVGGGGGGGAVKDNQAYKGGKGANGMVVIEWSN